MSTPPKATNGDPALARLKSVATEADQRSRDAADKFRQAVKSEQDIEKARALLTQLVTHAFRARQPLHAAQLDALQKRVMQLKRLGTARQEAEAEIIDRRVDELLNPDLRWNAAASKIPTVTKPSPPSPRPVTASRTRHFYVAADPFGGTTVPASLLEQIAKDAETIYREHTRECFDQDPIPLAELCGIDVTLNPNGGNRSHTSYSFTPDGRVDGAMMYAQALSVVDWLIERGGKKKLLQCMQSVEPKAMADELPEAIIQAYHFGDLKDLETQWRESLKPIVSSTNQR